MSRQSNFLFLGIWFSKRHTNILPHICLGSLSHFFIRGVSWVWNKWHFRHFFNSYEIEWKDILEIWEFAGSVNKKELETPSNNFEEIKIMFKALQNEIKSLHCP
ncbi:hypothetical protein AMQ68_20125 [Chryseobacterium sp. ERMR1:04]|nr:hypothetical protein AMQ68_20125 [Chryseobacterium sp. ERMR1:04]